MAFKLLFVAVFAVFATQGLALTTIQLDDAVISHVTSSIHPMSIGVDKPNLFDTLVGCHIIYPNGQVIEAFPSNNLVSPASFAGGSHPFTACSIFFTNPPVSMSGTYEILSQVRNFEDNSETLTRRKFHLTFISSEIWNRLIVKKVTDALTGKQ